MTVASVGLFDQAPRPPTPPKDHKKDIEEALDFLTVDYSLDSPSTRPSIKAPSLCTPPESSPTSRTESSTGLSKKVGFKHYTVEHAGPSPQKDKQTLRPLPQIRKAKPLRSILKPNACSTPTPEEPGSSPAGYFCPKPQKTFPEMLRSIVELLGSPDPLSRLDGYQTLNGALKAYSDLPGQDELRRTLPQITSAVIRDLKNDAGMRTTDICTQALKLTVSLLHIPALASSITNDFRASLLDCALAVLAKATTNKAIANHYLALLAHPDFKPRSLSSAKADLLLTRLEDVQGKISGNSVIASRLVVYQRLIEQVPSVMLAKMSSWLPNILHGCLSTNDEICKRAIDCGIGAGLAFGTHYSAAKAMSDLFSSETETHGDYGTYFTVRLTDIAVDAQRSHFAPRIWSVVILFFRHHKRPLSHWMALKPLLLPIQKCLNSSDNRTKVEAVVAWNRLVFVTDLAAIPTEHRFLSVLKIPFFTALTSRAATDKKAVDTRKTTMSGFTNLLYYALQPAQSFERLDFFWDQYAAPVLPQMLKHGGRDGRYALQILAALLNGGGTFWNSDRANFAEPMRSEELPRLDAQWVRSRLPRLLGVFEPYIGASMCIADSGPSRSRNPLSFFVSAAATAGSQEVRTSTETRSASANIVNTLARIWRSSKRWLQDQDADQFVEHFAETVADFIKDFSVRCIIEENLIVDSDGVAKPAPTNAVRHEKDETSQSPFTFICRLLLSDWPSCRSTRLETIIEHALVGICLEAQTSMQGRYAILKQCVALLHHPAFSAPAQQSVGQGLPALFLHHVASLIVEAGDARDLFPLLGQSTHLLVQVLQRCLEIPTGLETPELIEDFAKAVTSLTRSTGPAGAHLAILDPVTDSLLHNNNPKSLATRARLTAEILGMTSWSVTQHQLERSWKMLKGRSLDPVRGRSVLPLWSRSLQLSSEVLRSLYNESVLHHAELVSVMKALRDSLARCNGDDIQACLEILSSGLGVVLQDSAGRMVSRAADMKEIVGTLRQLWIFVCCAIQDHWNCEASVAPIAILLESAFTSRDPDIVNRAIEMWNAKFGPLYEMECPSRLQRLLQQLGTFVDLRVPSLLQRSEDDETFTDALADIEFPALGQEPLSEDEEIAERSRDRRSATPFNDRNHYHVIKPYSGTTPGETLGTNDIRHESSISRTPQSKAMPPPKLRHENSQIEFVSIENLPSELTDDGSQGLTEHQKEVQMRQHEETSALFPQISSSPAPPSSRKNMLVVRMDEMQKREAAGEIIRTPDLDKDPDGPMDGFFGSSPAAQSAQRAQRRSSQLSPVQEDPANVDEEMDEVPSSPPELVDDDPPPSPLALDGDLKLNEVVANPPSARTDAREEISALDGHVDEAQLPKTEVQADATVHTARDENPHPIVDDHHDSSVDPTADSTADDNVSSHRVEGPADEIDPETPIDETVESSLKMDKEHDDDLVLPTASEDRDGIVDVSRIQDSFADVSDAETTLVERTHTETEAASPKQGRVQTPRNSKKRRLEEQQDNGSAEKRRKVSPLKRFFTSWMSKKSPQSHDQPQQDEDLMDCIVVNTQPTPTTEDLIIQPVQSESQPDSLPSQSKRKPGRPRKGQTPNPRAIIAKKATPAAVATRRSKRRSSVISDSAVKRIKTEEIDDSSVSSLVSSPGMTTRRQVRLQKERTASSSPVEPTPLPQARSRRGKSAVQVDPVAEFDDNVAVVIPATETPADVDEAEDPDGPESQLLQEEAAAAERLVTSPSSIMGRLKGILDDVREMGMRFVLGGQEEREMTGMLWELGAQVHAAGRRDG